VVGTGRDLRLPSSWRTAPLGWPGHGPSQPGERASIAPGTGAPRRAHPVGHRVGPVDKQRLPFYPRKDPESTYGLLFAAGGDTCQGMATTGNHLASGRSKRASSRDAKCAAALPGREKTRQRHGLEMTCSREHRSLPVTGPHRIDRSGRRSRIWPKVLCQIRLQARAEAPRFGNPPSKLDGPKDLPAPGFFKKCPRASAPAPGATQFRQERFEGQCSSATTIPAL
jgi:hypothetical protein